MRTVLYAFILSTVSLATFEASACDWDTGKRNQHVFLSWNGERVRSWDASVGSVEEVALPNGFELGIRLDEPELQKYVEVAEKFQHVPEMVKISLFDLNRGEPELLSRTYAGTNSIQGFGARGGANRVEPLGDPGIQLTLLKPVCVEAAGVLTGR